MFKDLTFRDAVAALMALVSLFAIIYMSVAGLSINEVLAFVMGSATTYFLTRKTDQERIRGIS